MWHNKSKALWTVSHCWARLCSARVEVCWFHFKTAALSQVDPWLPFLRSTVRKKNQCSDQKGQLNPLPTIPLKRLKAWKKPQQVSTDPSCETWLQFRCKHQCCKNKTFLFRYVCSVKKMPVSKSRFRKDKSITFHNHPQMPSWINVYCRDVKLKAGGEGGEGRSGSWGT